jgi:hypothetical protein
MRASGERRKDHGEEATKADDRRTEQLAFLVSEPAVTRSLYRDPKFYPSTLRNREEVARDRGSAC